MRKLARTGNDVVVGEEIPVGREDDARADAARPSLGVDCGDMGDGRPDPFEGMGDPRRVRVKDFVFGQ